MKAFPAPWKLAAARLPAAEMSPKPAPADRSGPARPSQGPPQEGPSEQNPDAGHSFRMADLGRHGLIYGLGIVIGKAVAFLMLPIYTRYLTPADYGVLQLTVMTIEIISIGAGSWLAKGIFHYYYKAPAEVERRRVLSTAVLLLAVTYSTTAIAALAGASFLAELAFGETGPHVLTVRIAAAGLAFDGLLVVPVAFLRLANRSRTFVAATATKLLLQLVFNVIFIIPLGMGVNGVVLGQLLASLIIGGWLTVGLVREVGIGFSPTAARDLARFGFPLMGVQIASFILTFGDSYFLNRAGTTDAVGIYRLAYQFGMLPATIGYLPFSLVWDPTRFAIARRWDRNRLYARAFVYMNVLVVSIAVAVGLFVGDFLRLVADRAFHGAAVLAPVILGAYVVGGWTSFLNLGIFIRERTEWFTLANWLSASVAMAGYLLLIPRLLAWGAALTTLLAFAVRHFIVYSISQRLWPVRYEWHPVLKILVLSTTVVAFSSVLPPVHLALSVLIHITLFAVFSVSIWSAGILTSKELAGLLGAFRSPRRILSGVARS